MEILDQEIITEQKGKLEDQLCKRCNDELWDISEHLFYYWRDWIHIGLDYLVDEDNLEDTLSGHYFNSYEWELYDQECKCENNHNTEEWWKTLMEWSQLDLHEITLNHE